MFMQYAVLVLKHMIYYDVHDDNVYMVSVIQACRLLQAFIDITFDL